MERYSRDASGRVIAVTDALGQVSRTEYDAHSRPARWTDRKGQVTTVQYDERGQPTRIARPDRTIELAYDAVGRLSEWRDGTSVVRHQYDALDRLTQVDTSTAAGSHRLAYEYDSLHRLTRRTLSGSALVEPDETQYSWDLAGRLLSQQSRGGGQVHTSQYSWDAAGRLSARTSQIGQGEVITQRYGYDGAERLSQIRYIRAEGTAGEQLIEQIDHGHDARGLRVSRSSLNGVLGQGPGETPMQAIYDAGDRLVGLTLSQPDGGTKTYTLSHDANGNLVERRNDADAGDVTRYGWDSENRLVSVQGAGVSAAYSYDGLGRRIQASIAVGGQAAQVVQYVHEGQQVLGEIRQGRMSHRLLAGLALDELIARVALDGAGRVDLAASRQMLSDAQGSVMALLKADGTMATAYGYSPYGEVARAGGDDTGNASQYTGRENDGTGLYFYRARYYDPVIKRFIQSDPIGLAGGINTYTYVEGNPLMFTDPQGLFLTDALGGAGSYFRGIYRAGVHLYRRSGFDGECEQQRAIEDEALLAAALYSLSDRRVAEQAFNRAIEWASNNKAYMAGRFGTGAVVGFSLGKVGPFGLAGGLSMGAMAAMGDALHGVANGADNPEQVLRNIFGENAPGIPSNRPNRTFCSCRR